MTAEQARQLELAGLRYSLMLRVAELADLAAPARRSFGRDGLPVTLE